MKQTAMIVMIISLLFGFVQPALASVPEVQDARLTETPAPSPAAQHWAAEAMSKWAERGIVQGNEKGDLQPDKWLTRAELVAIINRLFGFAGMSASSASGSAESGFSDVAQNAWYYSDILLAADTGYMKGYSDGTMKPDAPVTREETIVMLQRLFMLATLASAEAGLTDGQSVQAYAKAAMDRWLAYGYIKGDPNGSLRAADAVTRAEFLTLLDRVIPVVIKQGDMVESQTWQGNAFIKAGDVTLKNITIEGDLYITEGSAATVLLDSVRVKGRIIVQGGVADIVLQNSTVRDLYVATRADQPAAKLISKGTTTAGNVYVMGSVTVEQRDSSAGFGSIVLAPQLNGHTEVKLKGQFAKVASGSMPDPFNNDRSSNGTFSGSASGSNGSASGSNGASDNGASNGGASGSNDNSSSKLSLEVDGQVAEMRLDQPFKLGLASSASFVKHLIVGKGASASELSGERQQYHQLDNQSTGLLFNKENVAQGQNVWGSQPVTSVPPEAFNPTATAKQGTAAGTTAIEANLRIGLHLAIKVTYDAAEQYEVGESAPSGGTVINPYRSGADISGVDTEINNIIHVFWLDQEQTIVHHQSIELMQENITDIAWELLWEDDFSGNAIDTSKWNFVEKGDGFGNNELQYYTARDENARIENGNLVIEARKEPYQGLDYTSAKLTTEGKASWTYGKFEIRAKLPQGQGMWPAIWMMPEDMGLYDTWPSSGELDIMELIGSDMNTVHGTLHYGTPHTSTGNSYQLPDGASFADDFHTFTIEWEPGEIRWYVDNKLYAVQSDWFARASNQPADYTYPAPFDRDFYMQLNVAVGGAWPGSPDASTQFPQQMLVDYVKAYDLAEGFAYREAAPARPGQRDQGNLVEGKAPLADGNYIYNGKFDEQSALHAGIENVSNSSYWSFRVGDGGAATAANDNDAMKLSVSSGGTATYAVQLIQHPVPLELGQRYRLTFDAKSSTARNMEVKLSSGGEGGWSDYAASGFALDSSWQQQQFDFTMYSYTHPTARIEFNVGAGTGDVWLDNIKLVKIDAGDMTNRPPLSDGNYIYNGEFNQGLGSLAFWEWQQSGNGKGNAAVGSDAAVKHAKLTIETQTAAEQLQLQQKHVYLEEQGHYVLSFQAKSDIPRDMTVRLLDSDTKQVLLEQQDIALTTGWSTYQQHFQFNDEVGKETELQFLVGGVPSVISLDKVRLEKLTVYELDDKPVTLQAEQYTYETAASMHTEGSSRYMRVASQSALSYMIDVAASGSYKLALNVRSEQQATLSIGEQTVNVPDTNGQWSTVYIEPVELEQGLALVKLDQFSGELDLNWLAFMKVDQSLPVEHASNLVRNGLMQDDLNYWEFWTEAGASIRNDNAQMRIDVSSVGGQSWSILTKQPGIALQQGKFYTLSFTAKASKPRAISVGIENNYNARYMNDVQLNLGTQPKTYAFDFEMKAASDVGALVFQLGNLAQAAAVGQHSIWIDDIVLTESRKVAAIPFTLSPGEQEGSTSIGAAAAAQHQLAVIISDQALPVPNAESTLPLAEHVIAPYSSGTDIAGADAEKYKYIALYELDQHGWITRFQQKMVTAQDLKPYTTLDPAPLLEGVSAAAGTAHSTTRITANAAAGNHLVAQVSNTAVAVPERNALAPQGGTVVNPYRPGSDLSGVDAVTNRYVALYEVNESQEVQRFALLQLEAGQVTMRDWQLVWQDEFDGASVDESKWNYVQGGGGYGNQELQHYTNRSENARIEDGKLVIEARKENYQGSSYTSAKLETSGKASWTYGRYEVRAKLPQGQGLWPAIWMMPEDMDVYGTWPASGELDIMEALGHEQSVVHGTLHYGEEHASRGYSYTLPGGQSFSEDYHTFATEWEPGEIRFYVDDILYAVQNDWFAINNGMPDVYTYPAPFDRDFYMQLNVAVGGTWPGNPDASTVFPQSMAVDYVRVYALDEDEYRKISYQRPGPRDQSGTKGTGRAPLADGNYIYNGGFTQGEDAAPGIANVQNSAYWTLNDGSSFNAAATAAYDQGWMKLNITNGGAATYAVQLMQQPLSLEMDKSYTLTFKARASANRNMEVKLSQAGDGGWTDYGRAIAALTTEPQTYQMSFKMLSNTHHNARLELNFGGATGDVWIDDVVFMESGDEAVVERQPLADGNYVYNGQFELGTDFMSYWQFTHSENASAQAKVSPKIYERSLHVDITNGGTATEDVIVEQRGLPLVQEQWYEVSFKAKAGQNRAIDLHVLDGAGAQGSIASSTIELSEQWNSYTYQFRMDEQSTINGRLQFLLGGSNADVSLDDISLKRYFPPISLLLEAEDMTADEHVVIASLAQGQGSYAGFGAQQGTLVEEFEIEKDGTYMLSVKLSAYRSDRALSLLLDGEEVPIEAVNTHGEQRWTVATALVELEAGAHSFELAGQQVNIDWLELAPQLVRNGDFTDAESATDPWTLWVGTEAWAGSASAAMTVNDGALQVNIDQLGSQFWSVQLNQQPLQLQQGKSYRLSFTASSSLPRDINVAVEIDGGYPQYMLKTVKLTEQLSRYTIDFTMNAMSREDGKLNFILGRISEAVGPHIIVLDDIMLAESRQEVPDAGQSVNLARTGTYSASSGSAAQAFDGNMGTRWESEQSDSQQIVVDLKKSYMIDRVKLSWETAFGKGYSIDVSLDGDNWQTVFGTLHGNGGVDELYFAPVEARFVRLKGTERGTPYGYSLYEFEVYEYDPTYMAEPLPAPQLHADQAAPYVKQAVSIGFASDERYFNSIEKVLLDGVELVKETDYVVLPGQIKLAGHLFAAAGNYEVTVQALHYDDALVLQAIGRIPPTKNLALGIGSTASSGDSSAAFDDNSGTRWISDADDNQQLTADLGDVYEIGRIVLDWEGAFGKAYRIEGSLDGVEWAELYSMSDGDGGIDEILLEATETRFVRMQGIERGTPYGYSLWSFEVYPYDPSGLKLPPAITPAASSYTVGENVLLQFAAAPQYVEALSSILVNGADVLADAVIDQASIVLPAQVLQAGTNSIQLISDGYRDVSLTLDIKRLNVAVGATVTASSSAGTAGLIVDGSTGTRWESEHGVDPQWIMLELTEAKQVSQLSIYWEGARAARYTVELSLDGEQWEQVALVDQYNGLNDQVNFDPALCKFIRVTGLERALPYGYSIFELEVY